MRLSNNRENGGLWAVKFLFRATSKIYSAPSSVEEFALQDDLIGYHTVNGERLSSSQAEPAQAIKSAVA